MAKKKNKKKRKKRKRNKQAQMPINTTGPVWMDEEGVHALFPGKQPPVEFLDLLTENFQKELRNSPMWNQMVEQFGEEEAEKLLKQCQAKFGP